MTKRILSAAAAVAVMTTGAMAFDAEYQTAVLIKENGGAKVVNTYNDNNTRTAGSAIVLKAPGELGDALIYPSFYSADGWSSEFSVINTSDQAVIAKVVLYGAEDSKELMDFNIYLSANDVFRATIKDGVITSEDGSTIYSASMTTVTDLNTYNWTDTGTMASATNKFEHSINGDKGYIAVYGMASVNWVGGPDGPGDDAYHKKHNELWRDYRHMLDTCRGDNWRSGIVNGIYADPVNTVTTPNVQFAGASQLPSGALVCGRVRSAQSTSTKELYAAFVPAHDVLTGSIRLTADDSKGTRSMRILPVPVSNYTDDHSGQMLLWTEGELASINDRCIDHNGTIAYYEGNCVMPDAGQFAISNTLYEFGGSVESALLITQPYKRVAIQAMAEAGTNVTVNPWTGIVRPATQPNFVSNYGGFALSSVVYNDDEDHHIGQSGGFIVSPATTDTQDTILPEMAMITNPTAYAEYDKGYAIFTYPEGMHGIVTQMSAVEVGGTVETNWLYPFTNTIR